MSNIDYSFMQTGFQNIEGIDQLSNTERATLLSTIVVYFEEAIKIVEILNDSNLKGVFHCFTGSTTDAKRIIELEGFYLGIGGVLTFKNSGLDKTIKEIDLQYLILETDAPYLAPAPFRGKRNESKYIINIAEKLAEVHQINIHEVANKTTENAKNLFNL